MRVIISGPVTEAHLQDAELLAGITTTSYVTNGRSTPPAGNLPVDVHPICKMVDEAIAIRARDYRLAHNADALVCAGRNDHLVALCQSYGLPVYEVDA